jgi:hypothetical protein
MITKERIGKQRKQVRKEKDVLNPLKPILTYSFYNQ